jgi:hypothetical protein
MQGQPVFNKYKKLWHDSFSGFSYNRGFVLLRFLFWTVYVGYVLNI